MKTHCCPKCKSTEFSAHQLCRMDVIVNGDNIFERNFSENAAADIYDAETPYGPYECMTCGAEYDDLEALPFIETAEIKVSRHDVELLNNEPCSEEECLGEDEPIVYTAQFEDDIEMDIKICGVQYDDGEGACNLPWTEAVLFHNGEEVACTEPSESLLGEWTLDYDGITYHVNAVINEDE